MSRSTAPRRSALALVCAMSVLSACNHSEDEATPAAAAPGLSIDMQLPASLTGGKQTSVLSNSLAMKAAQAVTVRSHGTDVPCTYVGADEEDPFRNGYEMSKFMLSVVAAWTCISDTVIDVVADENIPKDGSIIATDNELDAIDYDPEDPTHFSVSSDNNTRSTVKFYYGKAHDADLSTADPGLFLAWDGLEHDDVQGRLVIDIKGLVAPHNPKDPVQMRMDFDHSPVQKQAKMYLRFADEHEFANGFRIDVVKDLTARASAHVYTAQGLIDMTAQFSPAPGITETPKLKMYTVSDRLGEGAAIALMEDVALPLELVPPINNEPGNHLGNYRFNKTDRYFFKADQNSMEPWDYIFKEVTSAEYRGGRTTLEQGGSWDPFNPTLDLIRLAFGLPDTYFKENECGTEGTSCLDFLNALFEDGLEGQEQNQGVLPSDWRADAIADADYLSQVYPDDVNGWDTVFEMSFTPAE